MNVGTQSHVVGQIPAVVIGVVINDDLIAVPQPVIAVGVVERANTEEESTESKARGTAARQTENVISPDAAGKSSMLKRSIQMKAGIVARVIMPDPLVVGMHVGRFGVPALVRKAAIGRRRGSRRFLNPGGRGTVCRNVSSAYAPHTTTASLFLGQNRNQQDR